MHYLLLLEALLNANCEMRIPRLKFVHHRFTLIATSYTPVMGSIKHSFNEFTKSDTLTALYRGLSVLLRDLILFLLSLNSTGRLFFQE
jgi:hypothetical protein